MHLASNKSRILIKTETQPGLRKDYMDFIAEIVAKVYIPVYGELTELKKFSESQMKSKYPDFASDFMNPSHLALHELIDKITDGDIANGICLMSISYSFPLNAKLSPLALAGSFYNFKLLQAAKLNSGEKLYKRDTLPKMTYICFTGYYSELDIDVLSATSDNVQIIMIYDSRTGGPAIDHEFMNESEVEFDARLPSRRKHFQKVNPNLLLIPLDTSNDGVTSRELYDVFEELVFEGLKRFKPELVLINCPFNFNGDCTKKFPFSLKSKTWAKIFYTICDTAFFRVVLLPHKVIKREEYFDRQSENENLDFFLDKVLPQFSQPWDKSNIEQYMAATIEVITSKHIIENIEVTASITKN